MAKRIEHPVIAIAVGDDSNWNKSDQDLQDCASEAGFSVGDDQCDPIRSAMLAFLHEANLERHRPATSEALRVADSLASNAAKLRKQLESLDDDYPTNWYCLSVVGFPLASFNDLKLALGKFEIKARETKTYLANNSFEGSGRRKRPGLEHPGHPEAIRQLLTEALTRRGYLKKG